MEREMQVKLKQLACQIRLDTLKMLQHMGYGHLGGSFSIVELLAVLYGKQMTIDLVKPNWEERDQLVLSKGHAGPALYSTLANLGFFPKEMLLTLNQGGTNLPSHPDRNKTPGIDVTTGSLGQGISIAAGIATGFKLAKKEQYVYAIVGDGELNEGQCWEAFQYIAHHQLSHCVVIIDDNKKQLDGPTESILKPFDLQQKMTAFGFQTVRVKGDDLMAIDQAIEQLKQVDDQAVCLILDSVKGQGIEYFEQLADNHSVKFNTDEINHAAEKAIIRLEREIKEVANYDLS